MGKNTNKPVRLPPPASTGEEDTNEAVKPFHSKEYEQQMLNGLLNAPERPTWDEFKEQQRKKGELEGADARAEEEAQRQFRAELDRAREERLNASKARAAEEKKSKKSKKERKEKSKKEKKHKSKESKKHKRKRERDSSDSGSSSEEEPREKKRKKKAGDSKADGPVSLKNFFADSDSDSD